MHERDLAPLVCPETRQPLRLDAAERAAGGEIVRGRLIGGARPYPIESGIPSFVSAAKAQDQTVRSFAQKWAKHGYYLRQTGRFYRQWYLDRYGFGDGGALGELLARCRLVLDAGTGTGRDAQLFAELSRAQVVAVDTAWDALTAARADVPSERVLFVHADIDALPFADELFDFVSCDQVIHHLPDPRASFERLARKLKPGGQICCYVYRKKSAIREHVDDYVRERLSALDIDEALKICEGFTLLGRAFARLGATVEIEEDIPVLGIRRGRYDVQRFLHYNVLKCFWNDELDFFTNNIVNFDWYHPRHCFRFEPAEYRAWFERGWTIEHWDEQEAGLSCRARKV
ncbi:MAG: methyltransferase domain-containing protein [Deltaproteobacteria bacterium]|nr:methyltransferase domain-containing protein [Deltaproteobacteria bacterium]